MTNVQEENYGKQDYPFFLCGFMSGEMEKPLVIGKTAKPQCLKNMDVWELPIGWRYNKNSWMTSEITEERSTAFNDRMNRQNRHVFKVHSIINAIFACQ